MSECSSPKKYIQRKDQQLSDEKLLEEWETLAAVNCGKQDMILSVFLNESDVISTAQLFFTFEKSVLSLSNQRIGFY